MVDERKNQLLSQLMGGIQGGIPGVADNGSGVPVSETEKEYSLIEAPDGHALLPGTVIQIALDTAVNSDYTTANWRGVVTRPVYDLRSGTVLIPAGSAVLGPVLYAGEPGAGLPDRVGVAVDQIVRPDGSIVVLGESGMDHRGVGGISGDVNRHLSTRLAGFAAYAILGVAPALAVQSGEPESTRDLATSRLTSNIQTAGEEIARPYMNRRPTILLYPGDSLSVMLTQTLEFPS
jgi:type IV secretory pathway VirB10-like protein